MRAPLIALLGVLVACAADYPPVPERCAIGQLVEHVRISPLEEIDVLFVIDASPSMADEAMLARDRVAAIMEAAATGDRDGDGVRDYARGDFAFHTVESGRDLIGTAIAEASTPSVIRPGAVLAIIVITDGDDASAGTVDELATRLTGLRESPDLVTLTVIAGVPADLVDGYRDADEILSDPRLSDSPSCDSASASATPPRRLLEVVGRLYDVGLDAVVMSICSEGDWNGALATTLRLDEGYISRICVPTISVGEDGLANCVIYETLSGDERCEDLPGRSPSDRPEDDPATCLLDRVPAPSAAPAFGWFFLPEAQPFCTGSAIQLDRDVSPLPGSLLELRCLIDARDRDTCE